MNHLPYFCRSPQGVRVRVGGEVLRYWLNCLLTPLQRIGNLLKLMMPHSIASWFIYKLQEFVLLVKKRHQTVSDDTVCWCGVCVCGVVEPCMLGFFWIALASNSLSGKAGSKPGAPDAEPRWSKYVCELLLYSWSTQLAGPTLSHAKKR